MQTYHHVAGYYHSNRCVHANKLTSVSHPAGTRYAGIRTVEQHKWDAGARYKHVV